MNHNIINTGQYLLIVDDSEIKKETYCYDSINNILVFYKGSMKNIGFQKVISHLPLNNSPILEGVDLLPPLEDEVEKLAIEKYPVNMGEEWTEEGLAYPLDFNYGFRQGFINGYNTVKEKYKYTEEDLRKVFNYGKGIGSLAMKDDFDEYIQSLRQQKMPVGFKCEIDVNCTGNQGNGCFMDSPGHDCGCVKLKTTTNSQGLTQWVGTYY